MGHPEERDHGFPERIPWSPPPPPPHPPFEPHADHTPPAPSQDAIVDRVLHGGMVRPVAVGAIAVLVIAVALMGRNTGTSTIDVSSERALPLVSESLTTAPPTTVSTTLPTASTAATTPSSTTTSLSTTTTATSLSTTATTASVTSLAPAPTESSTTESTTTTEAPTSSPPTTIETTTTATSSGCDPNYSGCVPIASDVDCAGGSGNGPAYVSGPVQVIGQDIYGLDADNDGIGCERG